MSTTTLGRLEKVDLHEVWQNEARDFTPWLAKEDNLKVLGDTIGIDLELEAQEKNVGPFRADLLCKDTISDHWVLIENQIERTDHIHLGQLLTYAAGLKAVTIVWVAKRFTDEHRAALDWLNDITDDRFNFFALEIELWRIGDSPVAPKFNVVSKPNDWSRTITAASRGDDSTLTETKLLQRDYWSGLRDFLIERGSPVKPQSPLPQHWTNFAVGKSSFGMHASVNTQKNWIALGISCYGPDAKAHFHLLHEQKGAIEAELGFPLEWEELPNRKESKIALRKYDVDPTSRSDWANQHEWMAKHLEALYNTFSTRVKQLDASEYCAPETANA